MCHIDGDRKYIFENLPTKNMTYINWYTFILSKLVENNIKTHKNVNFNTGIAKKWDQEIMFKKFVWKNIWLSFLCILNGCG